MIVPAVIAALVAAQPTLPQAVMDSILRYTECTAVRANALAGGAAPAEVIVDAAVRACADEERRVLDAMTAAFGPGAADMIGDVRAGARRSTMSTIALRRGTAPPVGEDDAFAHWGICLSDSASARRRLSAEAAAEAALDQCRDREMAARSDAIGRLGSENGEAAMRSFREQFRAMVARSRAGGPR
jgi:hypothetical protein